MNRFSSGRSFGDFSNRVKRINRYIPDPQTTEFLDALAEMAKSRGEMFPAGSLLWRAQIGHDWEPVIIDGEHVPRSALSPLGAERMRPQPEKAREGRANPKGIPYLYLATCRETALAEVRPWIGSLVSVAEFRTARSLNLVNLTIDERPRCIYIGAVPEPEIDATVLCAIDDAFSEPVSRSDDSADYVPTQIIAELLKSGGFDGIGYRSSLGPGHNVALFDLNAAKLKHCYVFKVKDIKFQFEEAGSPY